LEAAKNPWPHNPKRRPNNHDEPPRAWAKEQNLPNDKINTTFLGKALEKHGFPNITVVKRINESLIKAWKDIFIITRNINKFIETKDEKYLTKFELETDCEGVCYGTPKNTVTRVEARSRQSTEGYVTGEGYISYSPYFNNKEEEKGEEEIYTDDRNIPLESKSGTALNLCYGISEGGVTGVTQPTNSDASDNNYKNDSVNNDGNSNNIKNIDINQANRFYEINNYYPIEKWGVKLIYHFYFNGNNYYAIQFLPDVLKGQEALEWDNFVLQVEKEGRKLTREEFLKIKEEYMKSKKQEEK
jgi:hypothetical protein